MSVLAAPRLTTLVPQGAGGGQVDDTRHVPGTKPIIDIYHRNPRAAGIEHGQQSR